MVKAQQSQMMQQAISLYGAGDWTKAEELCNVIAQGAPGDRVDALHLMGIIAAQTRRMERAALLLGRAVAERPTDAAIQNNYGNVLKSLDHHSEALDSYDRALKLNPELADAHNNRGLVLDSLDRIAEALASYDRALKVKPDYVEAHYNRGLALHRLKRLEEAVQSYDRAVKIRPDYVAAHISRGNAQRALSQLENALASYDRAVKIDPHLVDAHNNRGLTLEDLGRIDEALSSYERAVKIDPKHAAARCHLGDALRKMGHIEDALASYRHAVAITPNHAEAHVKMGIALTELRRPDDALECFDHALRLASHLAEAYVNRGNALANVKRFEEAVESYDNALQIKPDYAAAHGNRGNALRELRRFDEALGSYERALQFNPNQEWLHGSVLSTKLQLCHWMNLTSLMTELFGKLVRQERGTPPFQVFSLTDSPPRQREAARIWVNAHWPDNRLPPPMEPRRPSNKIRVGYYSADFHSHATANLAAELFELHDRDRFEILAFSFGPDKRDHMRKRLTDAFDQFIDVRTASDRDVAKLSADVGIDLAVDLKGLTGDGRPGIFAHRAAPVQVGYLGYPGTMSAPFMDYIVADTTLIPVGSRPHYSEKVIYLPNSYQVNDRKRAIAAREFSRADLGLPRAGFVFCCFCNSYKINPEHFDGWMRILKQVEDSVLWLLADTGRIADNLRAEAESRGVHDARLIFAGRIPLDEHLARHRAADLFIDTFPYNAHTTASDALWAGLPVLTRVGDSFAARVGASLLNAVGLPELIAVTQQHYEAIAVELATEPGRLAEIKAKLDRNRLTTPLFDTEMFTRQLESAYMQIYHRSQANLAPDDIFVHNDSHH
jgi:protein O-GlcNAc transferase